MTSLIAIKSFARVVLLVILPSWLTPGFPLLAISVKLLLFALDIFQRLFLRVWHNSLLSKLPSYGFYPSLCTFISSFLSGRVISAVIDSHCSPLNQSTVVSHKALSYLPLFLLFINDLSKTNCPIHSYAMTPLCITHHLLTKDPSYWNSVILGWTLQND